MCYLLSTDGCNIVLYYGGEVIKIIWIFKGRTIAVNVWIGY